MPQLIPFYFSDQSIFAFLTKIIALYPVTSGLIGTGASIIVVFSYFTKYYLVPRFARLLKLCHMFYFLQWLSNSPPNPHAFASLPLQSGYNTDHILKYLKLILKYILIPSGVWTFWFISFKYGLIISAVLGFLGFLNYFIGGESIYNRILNIIDFFYFKYGNKGISNFSSHNKSHDSSYPAWMADEQQSGVGSSQQTSTDTIYGNGFTYNPGTSQYVVEDPTGVRNRSFDASGSNQPYARNLANSLQHEADNRKPSDGIKPLHLNPQDKEYWDAFSIYRAKAPSHAFGYNSMPARKELRRLP